MTLDAILDELQPITGSSIRVTRDEMALTNSIYRITSRTGDWCLRINNPKAGDLGINRKRERVVLNSIQAQEWAPQVVAQHDHYLFSNWSSGTSFHLNETNKTTYNLDRLTQTIIDIQQVALTDVSHPLKIDHQLTLLMSQLPHLDANLKQAIIKRTTNYLPPEKYVLCHHDWHAGNVLLGDKHLTILDWEYAALGDPIIDLACLAQGFKLTDDQQLYVARQLGISKSQIESVKALVQAMSVLWYLIRFPNQKGLDSQKNWMARWA